MPAERSITAKLLLDKSQFSRELVTALAEAKAFEKAMSNLGGDHGSIFNSEDVDRWSTSVHDGADAVDDLNTSLKDGDRNGRAFGKGIAASNSHMALMVQYSLAFGPALVPALAAAVPLATALGSGLAFAAVGAGTAVLAFQGIGDALKAMNDYAIDPTEAHLKKLNETMDTLGPAGQEFVVFLQELRPEMQQLQNIAQEGMLPGVQEGIETLLTQMPLVESVISRVADAMGQLAADTGEALTSPFWTDFFEYIRDDASTIISNFSTGFGKLFEGIAALVLDFAPLTEDIAAGFANMGRSFSEWAQNLPQTQGFQEFIDYLREAGPEVLHTLGLLGKALLDLGVALSGLPATIALEILQDFAIVLSGLASSPVGPALLGAAVGAAALTRAIAAWDTVQASAIMQFLGGKTKSGGVATGPVAKVGGVLGGLLSQKGAILGAVGLIGLSLTDLDEKMGVSRTLAGAAIGSVFGPWGAAAGTLAGALMDASHANDEFNESVQRTINQGNTALEDPLGFEQQSKALEDLIAQRDVIQMMMDAAPEFAGQDSNAASRLRELNKEIEIFQSRQGDLETVLHATADALGPDVWDNAGTGLERLNNIATDIQPALDKMNLSIEDLRNLQTEASGPTGAAATRELEATIKWIDAFMAQASTVEGRSDAVKDAIAGLGEEAGNTAGDVDALKSSLEALFAPELNFGDAIDAWREDLRHLNEELGESAGKISLFADSDAASEQRQVLRDDIRDLLTVLGEAAGRGEGPAQVTARMEEMRDAIFKAGKEAGLRAPELRKFLDQLHFSKSDIAGLFEDQGFDKIEQQALDIKDAYEKIPKKIRTKVEADGVQADATVKDLMNKYEGLSRYDARTIIRAINNADPILNDILRKLGIVTKPRNVTVNVTGNAIGALAGIQTGLSNLRDQTVNVTTMYSRVRAEADGGYISGPGGPRDDKIPALLSNGEFVVNAAATARNLSDLYRINAQKFAGGGPVRMADGGLPGRRISATDIGRRSVDEDTVFIDRLRVALGKMRVEARQVERAEDAVHRARVRSREATQRLEQAEKNEHASKERLRDLQRQVTESSRHQEYVEKQLTKQRDQLAQATEKWKTIQGNLLQQAQAASSQVLSQGDIFGGQGTSISVGGILAKLRQTGKDAREFNRYINQLRGMGVNERIIQQLLEQGPTPEGLATAKNLANASRGQIRDINRAESRLVGASAAVGATSISHNTTVNFKIEKVVGMDAEDMGKAWPKQMRRALRLARSAS